MKQYAIITLAISFVPFIAQGQTGTNHPEPSPVWNMVWTIVPMLIVIALFIPFIRRMQARMMKIQEQHRERQIQHMERVERLLERIASSGEKRDSKNP